MNYLMGSGFLALPWGMSKTGVLLGSSILLITSMASYIAGLLIVATIHRTKDIDISSHIILASTSYGAVNNTTGAGTTTNNNNTDNNQDDDNLRDDGSNIERSINGGASKACPDVGELCRLYLGSSGHLIYIVTITVYLYCSLWSYAAIFSNAMAVHFNIGVLSYHYYLLLFMVIVTTLSCMELRTQVAIQLMLTACRFLLVISMITSIAFATFYIHEDKQLVVSSSSLNMLDYNTSGIKFMLPISVQSMIFHHSIPNLIRLVHSTAEKDIISIFGISISICLVLYMSLAVAAFSYFGQSIKSSSNLNWVVFISQSPTSPTSHWFMRCISSFIILYPAINVISSFPLNAITLGNQLPLYICT
jgi:amino acid permease